MSTSCSGELTNKQTCLDLNSYVVAIKLVLKMKLSLSYFLASIYFGCHTNSMNEILNYLYYYTLKCLSSGTPNTNSFPFVQMEIYWILGSRIFKNIRVFFLRNQGPVVQSIVSLTSPLRGQLVKFLRLNNQIH